MPWLHVTTTGTPGGNRGLAERLALQVADATGLAADAMIVLVTTAEEWSGSGAVVRIAGRDRGAAVEADIASVVRRVVADAVGCDAAAVAVLRS